MMCCQRRPLCEPTWTFAPSTPIQRRGTHGLPISKRQPLTMAGPQQTAVSVCKHWYKVKARLALTAIPREQRTYTECVERLRASYTPRKRPDEWIAELQNRRQAKVESFMQYQDALCTLALRVHGGDPNSASWLIAQFCDGLRNQDIGQRLAERDPPPPHTPYSLRLGRHHTSSASLTDVGVVIGWLAMSVSHPRSRMTRPPHWRAELGWISAGIAPRGRVAAIYRVGPPGQHTSPAPPS